MHITTIEHLNKFTFNVLRPLENVEHILAPCVNGLFIAKCISSGVDKFTLSYGSEDSGVDVQWSVETREFNGKHVGFLFASDISLKTFDIQFEKSITQDFIRLPDESTEELINRIIDQAYKQGFYENLSPGFKQTNAWLWLENIKPWDTFTIVYCTNDYFGFYKHKVVVGVNGVMINASAPQEPLGHSEPSEYKTMSLETKSYVDKQFGIIRQKLSNLESF